MRPRRAQAVLPSLLAVAATGTDGAVPVLTSALEAWLTRDLDADPRPSLGALYLVRPVPDLVIEALAPAEVIEALAPAGPGVAALAVSETVDAVDDDAAYDSLRETLDRASDALLARVEDLEEQRARLDARLLETYAALHTVQDQQAEAIHARYPWSESRAARAVSTEQLLVHELGAATSVPHAEAQRRLVLALARRRHRDLHARLAAGSVSLLHATLIEGATRELPDEVIPALVAKVLAPMPDGSRPSHQTITRRLRRAVASAADPLEAAARRRRGLSRRGMYGQLHEDGTGSLSITASAEEVVAILSRIDGLARRMRQHGDARTLDQLRSDLATQALLSHRYGPRHSHADAAATGCRGPDDSSHHCTGYDAADNPAAADNPDPADNPERAADPDTAEGAQAASEAPVPDANPSQGRLQVGGLLLDRATGEVLDTEEVIANGPANPDGTGSGDGRGEDTDPASETPAVATDTDATAAVATDTDATAAVAAGTDQVASGTDAADAGTDAADAGAGASGPGEAEGRLREQGWTSGFQTGPPAETCGCVTNPPPASVWIVVPFEVATGASNAASELPGHGWVTAEHARAIITAPGSEWRWLAVDQLTGQALRLGTDRYRPTPAMVEQVRALDGHCRGPGCTIAAHTCDIDHHIPYPTGPTRLDSLGPLHRFHHNTKTANLWTCTLTADHATTRALRWTTLAGRHYVTYPKDYRAALNDPPHPFETPRSRKTHRATPAPSSNAESGAPRMTAPPPF